MSLTPPPLPESDDPQAERNFSCAKCGAPVSFQPGTSSLVCDYCQHQTLIKNDDQAIEEYDFESALKDLQQAAPTFEQLLIKCESCGAETESLANKTATHCPFCDSKIVATAKSRKRIKPESLLPFLIDAKVAKANFKRWLDKQWLAPFGFKKRVSHRDKFSGVYLPYWSFDSNAVSFYRGQRGDYYYVTVTRTRTVNGKTQTYTTQERRTRWTPVSGTVKFNFDDVLVPASRSVKEKYLRELEPWDLKQLKPYQDEYLAGFVAESYQLELKSGFERGQDYMDEYLTELARRDIGGDEQRVQQLNTHHSQVRFKHLLLPVWLSSYRYKNKVFQFVVNARTGEVQGERPLSWLKIFLLALLAVALVAGGIYLSDTINALQ